LISMVKKTTKEEKGTMQFERQQRNEQTVNRKDIFSNIFGL
jgi:hypothetical protein